MYMKLSVKLAEVHVAFMAFWDNKEDQPSKLLWTVIKLYSDYYTFKKAARVVIFWLIYVARSKSLSPLQI